MIIDTKEILTMTEVNQNFSLAAKKASANGKVIIFKNNKPRFLLVDLESNNEIELTSDEKIDIVAKRILSKYFEAFKELAK
jgi:antitoxin Phd